MRTRLIVPRRPDHGHRDELWRYCRAHWERVLQDVEIVEGEHLEGPFNRAAAVNEGARGDWDVAIIIDADVILDANAIRHATTRAAELHAMVLPFTERYSVNRVGTDRILAGRLRLPASGHVQERQRFNVSTCVVVERSLWDEVRGFDERFVGWGGEDDAFHAVCRTVGTVERQHGVAWHLWHEISPERRVNARYRMAVALADRYCDTAGVDRRRPNATARPHVRAMRSLLAEDRGDDQVVVVCLTNGRRMRELNRTIASFEERVTGPIGRKLIVGDGCAPLIDGWQTTRITRGGTYRRAMREAQRRAIGSGQPWVFWLEDDWEFNQDVDLRDLQAVLKADPSVVQMSLRRQAWYRPEKAAGGIFETAPGKYEQRGGWVAHRVYWTQNPMLTRREILAEHEWPQTQQSEWAFARLVLADPNRVAGVWGTLEDPPWVHHLGERRAGTVSGY